MKRPPSVDRGMDPGRRQALLSPPLALGLVLLAALVLSTALLLVPRRVLGSHAAYSGPGKTAAPAVVVPGAATVVSATAVVIPGTAEVVAWNTQQVVFTAGSDGITPGGGLKVQLPKSWMLNHEQSLSLNPADDYYVTATTSAPGAGLLLDVVHEAVDGRQDWADWTAVLTVTGSGLTDGEVITCTFGYTGGGGRGVRAPLKADRERVAIAVDASGGGGYTSLDTPPVIKALPGQARRLHVVAPSLVTVGVPFRLALVAQDSNVNAVPGFRGTISFSSTDPLANLPAPYTFTEDDDGIRTFEITLTTPGPSWITATHAGLWPDGVTSNPIVVQEATPDLGLYWGDLHSHTNLSMDACGRPAGAFEYARDVARLDLYATSDHSWDQGGYTGAEWGLNQSLVAQYNAPGSFATFLGYEWTIWEPFGHRNVYFRDVSQPLAPADVYKTLPSLWDALEGAPALTIPQHTGKRFSNGWSSAVDWGFANDEYQRSVEIYSSHGQSERYDLEDPLSYENIGPNVSSVPGPHYARDGWAAGQRLGVIASTDDHTGRPGRPCMGLAAVYAPELTREALFDAIADGHTYGTTGQRIVLDFRLDGLLMGGALTATLPHAPNIDVEVVGTDVLSSVEVIKYDGLTYTIPFSITALQDRRAAFSWSDTGLRGDGFYYVRVKQGGEEPCGRSAMAWSSPVWVRTVNEPGFMAAFSGGPTTGPTPLEVTFTDESTGTIDTWLWEFGDGESSDQQHPTHEYSTAGTYTVSLTVSGQGGSDTAVKGGYITAYQPGLLAAFSGDPITGTAPLEVAFTDESTGTIDTWLWEFGDGESGGQQHPAHEYTASGTYSVSLTVGGPAGSDALTRTNYITVTEPEPVEAAFSGNPITGPAPLEVAFTDESTGSIDTRLWEFGDSASSDQQHPAHEYSTAGTYTVSLTVSGPGGTDTEAKAGYITVYEPPPAAAFSGEPTNGYVPLEVAFTDESTGMIDTWLWQFGDGASSDQQHPSREYTLTGTHTVTLTVSGPGGIDTEVKAGYISVSELAPPIPDIKANGTDGPLPVGTADRVNVSIALDPGDMGGTRCDWWGILLTRSGTKSLFRIQAPLRDLPATTVLNTALPRGWYTFVFALDDKPDGAFELDWYDFVVVTTTSVDGSPAEEMPDIEAIIRRQLRELRSLEAAGPAPWPAPE